MLHPIINFLNDQMPSSLKTLDLDLLRGFVTVVSTGSFTRAAERLLRQQSTLSLQIKRLEEAVGRVLLVRSPREIRLTPEGEAFLPLARRMLELNDEAVARLDERNLVGRVRLGTPEDFATRHLPDVLARFAQAYPSVALEVTCDLTLNLIDAWHEGAFDLVLVKREPRSLEPGVPVWREPLVWVGSERLTARGDALPLVVSPEPCVYRKRATQSLDQSGRSWRLAYVCGSLAGSLAAVRAGLGITVLPRDMVPGDLAAITDGSVPDLRDTEIALLESDALTPPAERLKAHIVRSLGHERQTGA
jgi:DNA-binding transcriptional LysR family regulator